MSPTRTLLYADFTCPWSYLAHRRLGQLRSAGLDFELRAVEHSPWQAVTRTTVDDQFACLREEVDNVAALLLPGEDLPYDLYGFVPHTRGAVNGQAEAHGAGVAAVTAPLLFEAFWLHGLDLDNASVVRTLLAEAVLGGDSPSDPLRRWGRTLDVTGGPMTSLGWRLARGWRAQWMDLAKQVVPVLVTPRGTHYYGADVLTHLATLMADHGVDPAVAPSWPLPGPRPALDGHGREQVLYPPRHVA